MLTFPRSARWAVPAGAVAVVAAVAAGSLIGVAQAAPALPPRTAAQLLASVAGSTTPPPPLTGTVVETASLGIPQLPGSGNPTSVTSLLAGSHTIKVWYAGPAKFRLSVPVSLGETDFIRNGRTAWLWQSRTNSVTRYSLPAGSGSHQHAPGAGTTPLTPQQAARQALAAVGPTTRVSVESNVMVAGQAAYELVLAPRQAGSLVGQVKIALDGRHPQVPLRVQVFARHASTPAFQVGYTSISFVRPAAANFTFTTPRRASVHTVTPAQGLGSHAGGQSSGTRHPNGWTGYAPLNAGAGTPGPGGTSVIGKGWRSVAVLPATALSSLAGAGNAASAAGQAARSVSGAGGSVSGPAVLGALLKAASPVHGSWGNGKLLRTSLVSILITNSGHVLVGAVTPSVLYAAVAHVK